jgi:4-amino-4-deoxy-L-arabinose transferase-like glycosyltransferase
MNREIIERYGVWFITAGLFFGFFFQLGSVPLFDLDEGAFTEATREMLASGNYLTTYLNGAPRFDKPILIYWFQALSVSLFGLNEFALRLPSALAATAWVGVLYLFARRFYDRSVAVMAAFFMATALQITVIAKAAIADALLNLFIASTMFMIYRYYTERRKLLLYAVFALIGLGALTKGPIAILVPGAVTLIFFAIKKDLGFWAKTVFNPVGLLIFAAVAGPWYVLEYLDQGQAFIDGFFLKHNVSRFSGSMEGHAGSLLYYIPVLLVGTLPYTTLLLKAVRNIRNWVTDDLHLFFTVWFLFVFVFFSLSGTKLPHYVIYGYTPLFVIMAAHIGKLRSDALLVLPLLLLFGFLLFLPEVAELARPQVKDPYARLLLQSAPAEFGLGYRLYIGGALAVLVALLFLKRLERLYKLIVLGLVSVVAINGAVIPAYAKIAQAPIKEAAMITKEKGYDVHLWRLNMPSFLVYTEKIARRDKPAPGEYVLTKTRHLEKSFDDYELIYEKHGIALAKIRN